VNSSRTENLLTSKPQDVTAVRVTNSYSHTFTHMNWLVNNRFCFICVSSEALCQKKKPQRKNKQHE